MGRSSVLLGSNAGVGFDPEWLTFAPTTASFEPKSDTGISRQDLQLIASLLDLTSLESDAGTTSIESLFEEALNPLPGSKVTVAGVCVFPVFLSLAGTWVRNAGVRLVAVAGGFPHALNQQRARVADVGSVVGLADEIDVPIPRYLAIEGRWEELYDDVRQMVSAAKGTPVKVILATGELGKPETVYQAAMVAMMAGASFIKTSTGKERINARLDSGAVMCQAIREYGKRSGFAVGIKPAGGIRTAAEAGQWVALVRESLGEDWLTPTRMRIGASGLLGELRRSWEGESRPVVPVTY